MPGLKPTTLAFLTTWFQIVMEEDESESNVELHEKMMATNGRGLNPRTLGLTANSQRAFESEREYKVKPDNCFFPSSLTTRFPPARPSCLSFPL